MNRTQPQTQTLKYILFVDAGEVETPVLFPPWVSHKTVADALREILTPVSAGFVKFDAIGDHGIVAVTFGLSDSLGLTSRPGDAEFLEPFL